MVELRGEWISHGTGRHCQGCSGAHQARPRPPKPSMSGASSWEEEFTGSPTASLWLRRSKDGVRSPPARLSPLPAERQDAFNVYTSDRRASDKITADVDACSPRIPNNNRVCCPSLGACRRSPTHAAPPPPVPWVLITSSSLSSDIQVYISNTWPPFGDGIDLSV